MDSTSFPSAASDQPEPAAQPTTVPSSEPAVPQEPPKSSKNVLEIGILLVIVAVFIGLVVWIFLTRF